MNETGDMDALAAEYVLGTLESGERAQALALMTIDPGFVDKIRLWERRLSELHLMVEPIEPDGKIWERIKPKLPAAAPTAEVSETSKAPEVSDEPAPSGVFDDLPEPAPATAAPAAMPAAPQLPSFLAPSAAPAESKPAPAPAMPAATSTAVVPPAIPERLRVEPPAASEPRRGRAGLWKALTAILTLILLAFAGLIAAWRFAPDRLPAALLPIEVLRELGIALPGSPPPRPPAPPESRYDE
jgi:uncharacterized membrane protein